MTEVEKHTSGPWQLLQVGDRPKLCPAAADNTSILTIVEEDGVKFAAVFDEYDARLIAAAPTMAEYISGREAAGDAEAKAIMEAIHGRG